MVVMGSFVVGAFLASPELRAYASTIANEVTCSGCVGTSDLASNAVTSAKIKDGEVKAAEIAANAVGASELQGVTKLQFTSCSVSNPTTFPAGIIYNPSGCIVSGLTSSDRVIVTKEHGNTCWVVSAAVPREGYVDIYLMNACDTTQTLGTVTFSVIVYRPG